MKKAAVPAARRIAEEHNIDISGISGSGDFGSVLTRDLAPFIRKKAVITPVAAKMAEYYGIDPASIEKQGGKIRRADISTALDGRAGGDFTEEPMSGMRNAVAEKMLNSISSQPQYTMCAELDTTAVFGFLAEAKEAFDRYAGSKLTFTDVMVKLTAVALMEHPRINSALVDGKIRRFNTAHIGIAVALDDGLIVPVVRHAESLSLSMISSLCRELVARARKGSLGGDEYRGSSFSISNLGNYPVDFSTPIINSPEGGILGISRTAKKPAVVDEQITVRTMTGFSLTLDHRIIDGIEGARFLKTLEELLNSPMCVLVEK